MLGSVDQELRLFLDHLWRGRGCVEVQMQPKEVLEGRTP